MASSTKHTYKANCHCGQVKLTFTIPKPLEESEVCRCNCSICTKSGYILVYPKREDVAFTAGEATLSEYRFGKKNKPHKFCPNCGTSMFIDFKDALDEWNAGRGAEEKQRQFIALNV